MPNWMGVRAYARHRGDTHAAVQKAVKSGRLGGDAISRDRESGRILAIDQELADAQWAANTDLTEAAKSGKILTPPAAAVGDAFKHDTPATTIDGAPNADPAREEQGSAAPSNPSASGHGAGSESAELPLGDPPSEDPPPASSAKPSEDRFGFYEAQARKEKANARNAELNVLKAVGLVISRDDQARVSARRYRSMRDALQSIPDRRCDELAAETDPTKIYAILLKEINQVLHELADDASAEYQRGAEEAPPERVAA